MHDVGLALLQAIDVDHVEVRLLAGFQGAAIAEAEHAGRFGGDAPHGFLDGVGAIVPVPVRQHERGPAGIDHPADVSARVAETGHRPVGGDELLQVLQIDVEAAHMEQQLAVALQRQPQPGLARMLARRGGDVEQALVARPGVDGSRAVAHRVVAPGGLQHLLVELLVVLHFRHQFGAEGLVGDGRRPSVEIHLAQFVPRRRAPEIVGGEADDAATGAGHGNRRDVHSVRTHGRDLVVQGLAVLGDGAEQHAAGLAFLGHEVHFLFHLAEVRHDLHEAPLGADRAGDGQHLLMGGERAGDRAPVRQRVAGMAVHGEAECAFLHRLRGERGDLLDFLRRRLLFDGALAHHVEARGAVANQAADVDHRAEAFDGIEVAAVGLPVPRQAG